MKNLPQLLKLVPIYVSYLVMWGAACFEKWTAGGVPAWFTTQFEKTILNPFPGSLGLQFYGIATLESLVFLTFAASLLHGEFLPERDRPLLRLGLLGSALVLAALSFGLRLTHDFNSGSQVFISLIVSFGLLNFFDPKNHRQTSPQQKVEIK